MHSLRKLIVVAALAVSVIAPASAMSSRAAFAQSPNCVNGVGCPTAGSATAGGTGTLAGKIITVDSNGNAKVSGGDIIGEVIMWAALILGVPLAGFLTRWAQVGAKQAGINISDDARARLQEIVEHGISLAASRAQVDLKDRLPINVKAGVAVDALQYVQDHGIDTLKQLGIADPNDPKAIEAVQARIAKALDDKLPPPSVAAVAVAAPAAA